MGNTPPFGYFSSSPFSVSAPCAADFGFAVTSTPNLSSGRCAADFGFAVASTPNLGSGILKTAASFALLLRLSVLGPS